MPEEVWSSEENEESAPVWETSAVKVIIGNTVVQRFTERVTAEDIKSVARERDIRRFVVYLVKEDGTEEPLNPSDFPIDPPAVIKILPLEKAG